MVVGQVSCSVGVVVVEVGGAMVCVVDSSFGSESQGGLGSYLAFLQPVGTNKRIQCVDERSVSVPPVSYY